MLDDLLTQLGEAIGVLDLDHLDRFPANTMLSVLSRTTALNRGLEAILTAASNQVAVRSDPVLGSEGLAARLNYARPSLLIEQVAGVSAATAPVPAAGCWRPAPPASNAPRNEASTANNASA